LILPNLKAYDQVLRPGLEDEQKKDQAERVAVALFRGLEQLEKDSANASNGHPEGQALKDRLVEVVGEVLGERVFRVGRPSLISAVLERDISV
jgi:transcription initiation factor TFIID subunit 6